MAEWRLYYRRDVLRGTRDELQSSAPREGVQVVVLMEPPERPRWTFKDADGRNAVVRDRKLWTGRDRYPEPFDLVGTLIPDEEYAAIWRRACTD